MTSGSIGLNRGRGGNGGVNGIPILTPSGATYSSGPDDGRAGFAVGGGLYVQSGSLTLDRIAVQGDDAGLGAGLFNLGTMSLTGCTISGDSAAGLGGGLYNGFGGIATLTNCTISGNSAKYVGGGLLNAGTATIQDCTISANSAGVSSGGLYNPIGTASLTDTIVAGNTSGGSPSDIGGPGASGVTGTYNLIGIGGSGGISNGSCGNIVLTSLTTLGLAPLGYNGGPLETMALLPGSAAIGKGTPIAGITTDQRGVSRPASNPDIGAYQDEGFTIQVTSGGGQSTPVGQAFANPLVVTVTANDPLEPVAGGTVTFAAPNSGPSANLSATIATIGVNGQASVTATANCMAGSYCVTATTAGAPCTAMLPAHQHRRHGDRLLGELGGPRHRRAGPALDPRRRDPPGRPQERPALAGHRPVHHHPGCPGPLSASNVTVTSAIGVNYMPVTISGSGSTYTITLATPINKADRVTITISSAAIGTFSGVLNVLPGDVGDYGTVNSADMLQEEYQWLGIISPTIFGDVTGDVTPGSRPTETDFLTVDELIGTTLPTKKPQT